MKKAFPFKKRLSAVLAVVLATACFAGTVPANAAESGSYPINVSGSHGTFEEYMWHLADNSSGDTLSFNDENQPVVTKGTGSNGSEFTALGSRRIELAAGKYQVSFSIKSSSQAYYIAGGFGFNSSGDANALVYENSAEGNVGTEWTAVTADFEVPEGYTSNEFRIILRGDAGTQITVKDLDVKAITEQVKSRNIATLDGWTGSYYNNPSLSYNNPGLDTAKIEAASEGADDAGSVHFIKTNLGTAGQPEIRVLYKISNGIVAGYDVGTEFVLEAKFKGYSSSDDPMKISISGSPISWTDGSDKTFNYSLNSSEWVTFTKEFKKDDAGDLFIIFRSGGYTSADFYIDNVKVYVKDDESKTNLISKGDFYTTEPTTTLDGWTGSYYNNPSLSYNNPGLDTAKIEVASEGADDAGSVHFIKTNLGTAGQPEIRVLYKISNGIVAGYDVGTEFVLEAKFKGYSSSADPMKISISGSPISWTDGSDKTFNYSLNSSEWVTFTKEFKKDDAGDLFIIFRSGGYTSADFYIDNVKVYVKDDESKTNLISNGNFCETEAVVSDTSAIDTSEYAATEFPGFDIGMIANENVNAYVVPGGSYNGSTALKITAQGKEGYFQTAGDESEAFPEQIRKGKIAFVKGDIAIKASGYFKKLEGSDAEAEPKVWFGFGKEYTVKQGLLSKKVSSVGSSYNDESKRYAGESYTELDNGWVKFEMTVDDETLSKINTTLVDTERVRFMCGIDCDGDSNKSGDYYGEALFDDIKFEIISKYAPGDANGDNAIDIRDLVHMKKYAAGTVKFTEMTRGTWLSDIGYNESPSITNEMVSMRKYLLGVTSEYGK